MVYHCRRLCTGPHSVGMSEIALEREEALICIPAGTEKLCCAVEKCLRLGAEMRTFFCPEPEMPQIKRRSFRAGALPLRFINHEYGG